MNNEAAKKWTREETMLAFELYCTIPSGKDTINNEEIINLANAINRSVNSVKLKLQNFKSYDPSYTKNGRIGLSHGSKLDEEVCNEFLSNWDSLIMETNDIKNNLGINKEILNNCNKSRSNPIGEDIYRIRKERVGQTFFRNALLAAYDGKCCFTGIDIIDLLKASHIKPWSVSNDINEKTNPQNGLLLNALHDTAFDKGYITITIDYKIIVSKTLLADNEINNKYFIPLNGKNMLLPSRFLPDKHYINYHNSIFRG